MQEPIVVLAEKLNNMKLDFLQLHTKMVEECGPEWIGDRYHVKIPVLSEQNSKLKHTVFGLSMKAGFDNNRPVMFYAYMGRDADVYVIRDVSVLHGLNIPMLSLSQARLKTVTDAHGRNTPPYLEFWNEIEYLRLATHDVAHLLATWYAAMLIGR